MRFVLGAMLVSGCAKLIEGGCASDADCEPGVSCNHETNRCSPPPCHGAAPGDDDPDCGVVDCDGLDTACVDYSDVTAGRCLGDGACKPANDPTTCGERVDLCAPYACDQGGREPACRASCHGDGDCASGAVCIGETCCQGGWGVHTVDSDGDVGQWARIAVDEDGVAHGAWLDVTDGAVRVGANTATAHDIWNVEGIPGSLAMADDTNALSLGVDAGGTIHVVHRVPPSGDLVYAFHDGVDWTVDGQLLPKEAALGVGSNGLAHVLSSAVNLDIHYGYSIPDDVSGNCIPGWVGMRLAATTDDSGRAHVTWWDLFSLRYGFQEPACDPEAPTELACCGFVQLLAATTEDPVLDPRTRHDISYDSVSAAAHITYHVPSTADLWHAACSGGTCAAEAIDTSGDVGRFSSIAVGAGGLHVVYYDASAGDLRYATDARGDWESSTIDGEGDVGAFASLARGPDGRLHALYYDADAKDAKYATLAPGCVPGE